MFVDWGPFPSPMTTNLLKGAATVCLVAVTLTCLTLTAFLAVFLKALIGTMPPPMMNGVWSGPVATLTSGRGWGPEQATKAPDTPYAGDQVTAWASLTTDAQDEWLQLTYKDPVDAAAVLVYETYNPGAVVKIAAVDGGKETVLWEGSDPAVIENGKGVAEIPVSSATPLTTIKVYVASTRVFGWNEIDAVGLKDKSGSVHWAETATASSTFADPGAMPIPQDPYAEALKAIDDRLKLMEDFMKAKK